MFLHDGIEAMLDRTTFYRFTQSILAPGYDFQITKYIRHCLSSLPRAESILDVGCGPASLLWKVGLRPVGLDISQNYAENWLKHSQTYIHGSADNLPFADRFFDGVWSVGLFHHLSDDQVRRSLSEMRRVCKINGYISIIDGVFPHHWWSRPLPYLLRKADRGRFMRTEESFRKILSENSSWKFSRKTYSLTGLEMMTALSVNLSTN